MSSAFARLASVTASTKRVPAISGGKRGAAATNIASLKCTPLDPVDADVARRMNLGTAVEVLQTFCEAGLDIKEGDLLVVASIEYPIRSVSDWAFLSSTYLHLILDQQKTP